ncbi:unnamed protein product [Rhizoctonia solani]|uniref:DDE-1 domain-containing protein n=1 Tax=Rhizoctonia solani TaxID=456999 RepID=A0A8H3BJ75_9AGAM|nr:unnamed protein product [Rhizoctonia solani]
MLKLLCAWMRTNVLKKWFRTKLRLYAAVSAVQDNDTLLRSSDKKADTKRLTNVRIEFLAPKLTAFIQPLDAGVIRCFKAHYRQGFLQKVLERDATNLPYIYCIDQLQAMQLSLQAWDQVAPSTINNCWHHTGICPPTFFPPTELPVTEDPVMIELQSDLDKLALTEDDRGRNN